MSETVSLNKGNNLNILNKFLLTPCEIFYIMSQYQYKYKINYFNNVFQIFIAGPDTGRSSVTNWMCYAWSTVFSADEPNRFVEHSLFCIYFIFFYFFKLIN